MLLLSVPLFSAMRFSNTLNNGTNTGLIYWQKSGYHKTINKHYITRLHNLSSLLLVVKLVSNGNNYI